METPFRKLSLIVSVLLLTASLANAQLPSGIGWHGLGANTILNNVCAAAHGFPLIAGVESCSAITADWAGGAFDTLRNRLLITGGGHAGYAGNEIYGLNLNNSTMTRLNDPTYPPYVTIGQQSLQDPYADGRPSSRHTYDCVVYMPNVDRLFTFSGGPYGQVGGFVDPPPAFTLDLANISSVPGTSGGWSATYPSGASMSPGAYYCAYDPNTGKVIVTEGYFRLYAYDFYTNSFTQLNPTPYSNPSSSGTSIIDVANRMFVRVGSSNGITGSVIYMDISGNDPIYNRHVMTTTGGDALVNAVVPGLAYDSDQNKIVGWGGGDTAYVLTPNYAAGTGVWTPITYTGGPGPQMANGTYKRFAYSPVSKVFVLYNQTNQPGYILRLYDYGSSDTTPPVVSLTAPASGSTVSGTITVSANASDNVGVAGVQVRLDGANFGSEDTTSPYSISWNTTQTSNGSHTLTATARDAAGNQTTSGSVSFTVNNVVSDTQAPTTPTNFSATAISSSQINLSWTASTDNAGVTGYRIYRCQGSGCAPATQVAISAINSYSDTGLSASTVYAYRAAAYDAAGNASGQSPSASATTQASPPPSSNSKFPGIPGCTNADYIDADCDGYGVGSPNGVDGLDTDPAVNTASTTLAKYTVSQYLTAKGYPTGNVYYISLTGNDSTGVKNDPAHPYLRWTTVEALLRAGDVVMFRGGIYYGSVRTTVGEYGIYTDKQGTSSNPIVIMSYPGEDVIIDTLSAGFQALSGATYLIIDGFVFANTRSPGNNYGGNGGGTISHITVRNVEIYGWYSGILMSQGLSYLTIEGCAIHDNIGEHNIYLAARGTPNDHIVIQNNLIYRSGGRNGIQINGRSPYTVIQNNIIHSNAQAGLSLLNGISNSTITQNYIFNNAVQGIVFMSYSGETGTGIAPYGSTGTMISDNAIWVGKYNPYDATWFDCTDASTSLHAGIQFTEADLSGGYISAWQADHYYDAAAIPPGWTPVVIPTTPNGRWYWMSNSNGSCTSGSSQPNWNTTLGATNNDGSCTWLTLDIPTFDSNIITNNAIVTYSGPSFRFSNDDYWDTITISNNKLYKTGPSTAILRIVSDYYTMAQFNAKSGTFAENSYGDPEFNDVSINYCATPEKFDFTTGAPPPPTDTTPPSAPQNVRVQ